MARYKQIEQKELVEQKHMQLQSQRFATIKAINKCSPLKLFEGIINGSIDNKDLAHLFPKKNKSSWEHLYRTLKETSRKSTILRKLLSHILSVSDNFITDIIISHNTTRSSNASALDAICSNWDERVREIETWEPKRNNHAMQLKSLIKHLYCKYPAPDFLINSFPSQNQAGIYLYIHLGNGGSMKNFPFLPNLVLNKKIYQHLLTTPDDYDFLAGFRRAQILSMGGDEKLFSAVQKTQEIREGRNDTFWVTVIDMYIKAEMFDYNKIPEINDYIRHMVMNQRPHAPYSMKGKTIASLLNKSNRWHKEAAEIIRMQQIAERGNHARARALGYRYTPPTLLPNWNGFNIPNFQKVIKRKNIDYKYDIVQIKTHQGLIEEGRYMHHCVGSYAGSCAKGDKAIFSLREVGLPLVTIEVNKSGNIGNNYLWEIVQMKASNNRKPSEPHVNIIKEWATKYSVSIGRYL
jgi:hypothetical protein